MKRFMDTLDKLLLKKWFYVVFTLFFLVVVSVIFGWRQIYHLFNPSYVVDDELLGTYGDFVGGVLGTIFALISILFLIRTFNQQREVTEKNQEQLENQRFNDLFFELLRLYHSEKEQLKRKKQWAGNKPKDFFDIEKERMQKEYVPETDDEKKITKAISKYMEFYIENSIKVGACFRTLYRIYDLIDHSELPENAKRNYAKIVRAQLTDSELFLLRYNGMTYYGMNFISYINKYNILKHLPAFELLEFKTWWKDLDAPARMGVNILFQYCNRLLRKALARETRNRVFTAPGNGGRFKFEIRVLNKCNVEVQLTIDKSAANRTMEYRAFEEFSDIEINTLFESYLKEIFIYSNFKKFNKERDLRIYSDPIKRIGSHVTIKSGIINVAQTPLKIKQIASS